MKSNAMKRVFSALLLLVLLASALPITAHAAGGSLYVTGYTVTDSAGSPVGSVTKGATVNITVSIKDTGTGASDPMTLDVTKLDDSFTGGSVRVESASCLPGGAHRRAIQGRGPEPAGPDRHRRSAGVLSDHGGHCH